MKKKNLSCLGWDIYSLKKILLTMRISVFLLIINLLSLQAVSFSQNNDLNVKFEETPLKEVIQYIEFNSGFRFLYNEKSLEGKYVTLDVKNMNVKDLLKKTLDNTENSFRVLEGNLIVIAPFSNNSQEYTVKGRVVDINENPLPGVNIIEKGTTNGAVTDLDGNYSISVSSPNAVLSFSFIGYLTEEINVGNQSTIDVKLIEDIQELDEVVVVGYGTMKKSDLTGSVSRINMDEKSSLPNISLSQALSGASSGVNMSVASDDDGGALAGAEPNLSIRGKTSLSANDKPLIVLDGIIYNGSITDINVNDIEHIDILKDASAAAVYGARSANGVIIITTKKGTSKKPLISFNMNYGFQDMTNSPMKVMNAEQYAVRLVDYYYQQDLYTWYHTNPTSDAGKPVRPDITDTEVVASRLRTEEEKDNYRNGNEVDWVDAVTRVAPIQNYNLNFSGMTERLNYFVSGGYTNEEGILENDKFERFTLRTNLESDITDWFTLGLNLSYSYRDYSGINADLNDARSASPLANNDIGDPNFATWLTGETYMPNPLGDTYDTNEDIRNNVFFVTKARIKLPFIEGLTYDFNFSNTYSNRNNFTFYPVYVNDGSSNNGKAEKKPSDEHNWIFNNIVTYLRAFDDHQINITLLYSREKRHGQTSVLTAEDFDNPVLGYNNMELGTIYNVESTAWEENSISYMARANYQFKNRYMITGTVRKDGFSGFGANSKYATLPSLSVGWVTSEEPFMNSLDWLYLKLRASYGLNGNQGIGRYSSFSSMTNEAYVYGPTTSIAVYPGTLGNSDLSWEKTSSFNLGFDYGLFDRRISGSLELYKAKTSDVLVERALPVASGYEKTWANIGEIENKGIELELTTHNIVKNNFQWNTGFIFSLNRDKITKLYGGENDVDEGNGWFVGEPISAIYDYEFAGGVWTEAELYSGNILDGWYPGQYRYVDQNDDNTITPDEDRKITGYEAPNYRFSITNTLAYKNLSLYFLLNSIQGGNGYYMLDNYGIVNVSSRSDDVYRINQSAVRQYWTPENGVDNATGIYNSPAVTSGIYEDRSFVRLQDVSLTYQFNENFLKSYINSFQVFIAGKNLYTWTKWSGWDPEVGTSNFPLMRNITIGCKLTF